MTTTSIHIPQKISKNKFRRFLSASEMYVAAMVAGGECSANFCRAQKTPTAVDWIRYISSQVALHFSSKV
jgi:hypothetical protein